MLNVIMIISVIAVAVVWLHYLYVKRRRARALEEGQKYMPDHIMDYHNRVVGKSSLMGSSRDCRLFG